MRSINSLFLVSFLLCNACYVDVGGVYIGDQEEDFDYGIQVDIFISNQDDVQVSEQDMFPDLNTQVCVDEVEEYCFDGIDNDCDGEIDEECDMYCQPSYDPCDDGNEHTEDWCSPNTWTCMNEDIASVDIGGCENDLDCLDSIWGSGCDFSEGYGLCQECVNFTINSDCPNGSQFCNFGVVDLYNEAGLFQESRVIYFCFEE